MSHFLESHVLVDLTYQIILDEKSRFSSENIFL